MTDLEIAETLCKHFEAFRSKPYLCPAGVATIGFGTTRYPDGTPVTLEDSEITLEYAEAMLERELREVCLVAVLKFCPKLTDTNKINALVDFVYNLGAGRLQTSTLRRKVNDEDWAAAQTEINRWVRGGGVILKGLVIRRQAESLLLN